MVFLEESREVMTRGRGHAVSWPVQGSQRPCWRNSSSCQCSCSLAQVPSFLGEPWRGANLACIDTLYSDTCPSGQLRRCHGNNGLTLKLVIEHLTVHCGRCNQVPLHYHRRGIWWRHHWRWCGMPAKFQTMTPVPAWSKISIAYHECLKSTLGSFFVSNRSKGPLHRFAVRHSSLFASGTLSKIM